MYPEERILIDKELKKRNLEYLICDYLYLLSYSSVIEILDLPCWNNPKFQGLLTSSIWNSTAKSVQQKLSLPYWNDKKYIKLLTPSIFVITQKKIIDAIEVAETFGIENWITIIFLRKSKIQLLALIHYLQDKQIPLIINEKLHPIFSAAPNILKTRYHIDLKSLVEQEKKREVKLC